MAIILPPNPNMVVTWENTRRVVQQATENFGAYPDVMTATAWAAAMDRYIIPVTEEGSWETTVALDRGSQKLADSGLHGDFIAAAELSCAIYNAQPQARAQGFVKSATYRNGGPGNGNGGGHHPPPPPPPPPPPASDGSAGWLTSYWYGYEVRLNHEACLDVETIGGALATIATFLAKLIPGAGTIICSAVAAALSVLDAWIAWADQHCGNQGIIMRGYWVTGVPFPATVC